MCCILVQPVGVTLPPQALENAWSKNDDGAGYMFAHAGKLYIRKPFFKLKALRKAYLADYAMYGTTSAFTIHFRWATTGACNETNTHPHEICGGDIGVAHNGIIDVNPPAGSGLSDTRWFCDTVLAYRRVADVMNEPFNGVLADMVGPRNKLVLMDNTGNLSIINEKSGLWDGGLWASNADYKTPAIRYTGGTSAISNPSFPRNLLPARYQSDLFTYATSGRMDEYDSFDDWQNAKYGVDGMVFSSADCDLMLDDFAQGAISADQVPQTALSEEQWARFKGIQLALDGAFDIACVRDA